MNRISHAAIRRPGRTLALIGLVTLAAVPGLFRLELRMDGQALVPRGAPAVAYDREIRRDFAVRDPMVVVVRTDHPQGIFNPATLRRVSELTAALGRLEGVGPADVTSLATETGFKFRPGTLQRANLLEPVPETPAALAELRRDLRRIGIHDGLLLSKDGKSAAVVVGVPPESNRQAFYRKVQEVASAHGGGGDRATVLGAPVAETLLGNHILADLGVPAALLGGEAGQPSRWPGLVPLSLLVVIVVFLIGFRRPFTALVPLAEVGVCLLVIFGLMGWLGVPVYLTTAVLPVILVAVGAMGGEVHIFRRYAALRGERPWTGGTDLARAAMEEVERPITQASVTTILGFLSFSLSSLAPVRAFGLFAAAGVALSLLWSLAATPAILRLAPPGWITPPLRGEEGEEGNVFGRLAGLAIRHRRAVLAVTAVAALLALDGVRRLRVQDSWVDGFAPESEFAQEMRRFDEQFRGAHVLLVSVEAEPRRLVGQVAAESVEDRTLVLDLEDAGEAARLAGSFIEVKELPGAALASWPGGPAPRQWSSWVESATVEDGKLVLRWPLQGGSPKFWLMPRPGDRLAYEVLLKPLAVPATVRQVEGLERFLEGRPGVGGVLGPAQFLETATVLMDPERTAPASLPETPLDTRILWHNSEIVRGEERLRRLVDEDYSRSLVTVFLKDSNYADTQRLMDDLREYEREHLAPQGLRLGFAGDVAVSQALISAVVTTQVQSLALSLLGIYVVTVWLVRSPRRSFYCLLPVTLAVLLNFAVMGWLGIPLGVATAMFAGMTLGVGVDSALHLLARFDLLRSRGVEHGRALVGAVAVTGPAIVIDVLSVSLGFAVLLLSQVPANYRLGGLLSVCLLVGLMATLSLMPALLSGRRALAE